MTTMTAQTTQVYSVFIKATPEQIWDAITKPEFTEQYFFGARIDIKDGRRFIDRSARWSGTRRCSRPRPRPGSCTASSPPTTPSMGAEEPSRVTWEIEPQDDGIT